MHQTITNQLRDPKADRGHKRIRAVAVALVCSGLVAVVEIIIGIIFNLQSVLSEGIHTLADMADSIVAFWAVKRSAAPPDKEHPFGHGKYESVAATVEGGVIALTGVWICYRALASLVAGRFEPDLDSFAIAAMGVSAVMYLFVSQWLMRQWRQTRSPAVHAEALHLRTHVFITAGLCGGLLAARLASWLWMDSVLALFVGLALWRTAQHVLGPAWRQLTDQALPAGELENISLILGRFADEYIEIHQVRSRSAGVEKHLDFHLVLRPETSVREAHELCDRIEEAVEADHPDTVLTIHVEPAGQPSTGQVRADKIYLGGQLLP